MYNHSRGKVLREYKSDTERFSWLTPLLFVLSLVCDAVVVWTIYLLVTHKIGLAIGITTVVVAILVSIWAKSPWRRGKARPGSTFVVFVITFLLVATVFAFSGMGPLVTAKNGVAVWIQGIGDRVGDEVQSVIAHPAKKPQPVPVPTCEWAKGYPTESYRAIALSGPKTMALKTIQNWQGTESKTTQFTVDCVPCVINYGYTPVGTDEHKMFVSVYKADQSKTQVTNWGVDWVVIDEKGDYTLQIDASGVEWWLKIGVQ
jgi:hypothetical protein